MESTKSRQKQEQLKSFDVLSSVNLYKFDLQTYGRILPETRQRVYDEELSYIVEGINRPNYKEFMLQSADGQLIYFHNGKWKPYISTLITGLETAKAEAARDYRKNFEVERRTEDLKRGYQMQNLEPGERLTWYYGFPHQELALYGQEFLGDMGFQSGRKMGYLCEAEKTLSGATIIRHQSVDNSENEAFAASMDVSRLGGTIEDMRDAYDTALKQKYGNEFFAGRRMDDAVPEENAWSVIEENRDLIEDYFMRQIDFLARQNIPTNELETAKKRLTYGVWATIRERLDNGALVIKKPSGADFGVIHNEVESAYSTLAARGEVLFGCGGSISGEEALLSASSKDVFESIFGRKMSCPFCGATQYGDHCSPNQFCSNCSAQVVNGRVLSKGNGRKKTKKDSTELDFFQIISIELARYEQERRSKEVVRKQQAKLKKTA
ncbi:MAG TPA: hypothetical protein VI336_03780 [Candidatus Saccharimonadales bacterium]|nr:hypothetical protein [Candidatus Saccharimonadales bacterium]